MLIVGPESSDGILIDRGRLEADEFGWRIDRSVPIPPERIGSLVVSLPDGKIAGLLIRERNGNAIAIVEPQP
jgi:hypothetical protein